MKRITIAICFVALTAAVGFGSSWRMVGSLNVPNCETCLVPVAVSPSGNTIVTAGTSADGNLLLFEKPVGGWQPNMGPTATLMSSDRYVFAYDEALFGAATDDSVVIAEAYRHTSEGSEVPVLLIWNKPTEGWGSKAVVTQSFQLTSNVNDEGWGSVGFSPTTIAVGATGYNRNQGAVYVWNNPPDTTLPLATLTASDGAEQSQFGYTLSVVNNTIEAGNCVLSDGSGNGAIYIFEKPSGGWTNSTQTAELTYFPDSQVGLGCYMAGNADTVASGVEDYDDYFGRIDIFAKPSTGWINTNETTAQLLGQPGSTGTYSGSTMHFATNAAGQPMIVSDSPIAFPSIDSALSEENIYYEPASGWGSVPNQLPSDRILYLNPMHWFVTGSDGAGANTVAFANCDADAFGCSSPIYVYQYK